MLVTVFVSKLAIHSRLMLGLFVLHSGYSCGRELQRQW